MIVKFVNSLNGTTEYNSRVTMVKIVIADTKVYGQAKLIEFLCTTIGIVKRSNVQGTTVLIPIAEESNIVNRRVGPYLLTEPIDES
jgi:hypothetical protein